MTIHERALNENQFGICIKLTFILFEEVLIKIHWITSLSMWSISKSLILAVQKIFVVRPSQIISSFCFAVCFWEVQSFKSQNLQNTDCVLNEYFQICFSSVILILRTGGHNRFVKSVYPRPQTVLHYMWQSARANQRARIRKNCHRNRWLTPIKTHLAVGKKIVEGHVLEKTTVIHLLQSWYNRKLTC